MSAAWDDVAQLPGEELPAFLERAHSIGKHGFLPDEPPARHCPQLGELERICHDLPKLNGASTGSRLAQTSGDADSFFETAWKCLSSPFLRYTSSSWQGTAVPEENVICYRSTTDSSAVCDDTPLEARLDALLLRDNFAETLRGLEKPLLRRAYVVLSMLVHSFVWGRVVTSKIQELQLLQDGGLPHSSKSDSAEDSEKCSSPREILPAVLGRPFLIVTQELLGIQPVLTHSSVDLWNWRGDLSELSQLKLNSTFTSYPDEPAFHLVVTHISWLLGGLVGERAYMLMNELKELLPHRSNTSFASQDDFDRLVSTYLADLDTALQKCSRALSTLQKSCRPRVFYNVYRFFLNGWGTNELLPQGLRVAGDTLLTNVAGGSAAQAGSFQVIDAMLGVEHETDFLHGQRAYMCRDHRNYVNWFSGKPNLKQYFSFDLHEGESSSTSAAHTQAYQNYKACVQSLTIFRAAHFFVVKTHILEMQAENQLREQDKNRRGTEDTETMATFSHGNAITPIEAVGSVEPANVNDMSVDENGSTRKRKRSSIDAGMTDAVEAAAVGTGGTSLGKFLRKIIDETRATVPQKVTCSPSRTLSPQQL